MPTEIEPCLATLVSAAPGGERWLHEIKWDGYRLVAFKSDATRLATRRGLDWTARFPGIAEAVAGLPARTAILDGEAVVEDEHGISSFSALQEALSGGRNHAAQGAIFYAFDLLWLDGADLRGLPLSERKARLAALVPPGLTGTLRFSEHVEGDGGAMVRSACQLGLEGVIAKRRDRPYRAGRGEDWVKVKCTDRQEFVIGGYVPAANAKNAVGSLALGFHEDGKLHHAGRAGTGFTAQAARDLFKRLTPLQRAASPFAKRLTAPERRGIVYVEPVLVAEIEFRGWTADRNLRQAAYKGLREDKSPDEVVRETAEPSRDIPKAASAAKPKAGPRAKAAGPAKSGGTRIVRGEVAGVALTHPERVLWDVGVTKQGLAEFYESIADRLLPHLVRRPLSLVRCPGGAAHGCFFQKHSWAGLGPDIRRESVRDEGGEEEILYVEDIRGVVSLVQAGVLEIHPWGTTVADVERPDRIVMDLDPGDGVAWAEVVAGAQDVRERLAAVKLDSFVKTTGGKGLHVVVPLTGRSDWAQVKSFAKALADAMTKDSPDRYIAKATKAARRGLIYVDYLRNGRGATAIAPYSTRARPGATVSVPVAWEELGPSLKPDQYDVTNLGERLGTLKADPWAGIEAVRQGLPAPKTRAAAGRSAAGAGTSPAGSRSPRSTSR